jgi:hypothetical protein
MQRLKRAAELLVVLVFFPLAVVLLIDIAIAVSLTGLFAYLGGLLAAWLLFAYVVPLATGIMTPDEIVAGIRSQRRPQFEGEQLSQGGAGAWWARWKPKPVEVESLPEGESLPEDRAFWFPWKPGESDSVFG